MDGFYMILKEYDIAKFLLRKQHAEKDAARVKFTKKLQFIQGCKAIRMIVRLLAGYCVA